MINAIEINSETDRNQYPDYVEKTFTFKVAKGQTPERIDQYLTKYIYNATRNRVQKAIEDKRVTVNGIIAKASRKVQPNDDIICKIMKAPPIELLPENIQLDIKFEDDYVLVVNKPPGMCTHPGFGNRYGTLVNAVLYHFGLRTPIQIEAEENEDENDTFDSDDNEVNELDEGKVFASDAIRPGIIHRLDKDTSGLLVIAKDPVTHANISAQFAARTTEREYYSLVWGNVKDNEGIIEGDIGRSSRDRKLFAVVKKGGKPAKTSYKVIERFRFATLIRLKLFTGRTHQIRVHLSHNHHIVFGDPAYGGDKIVFSGLPEITQIAQKCLNMINRQLLHAKTLGFKHPATKEFIRCDSDLPQDFLNVLTILRENNT